MYLFLLNRIENLPPLSYSLSLLSTVLSLWMPSNFMLKVKYARAVQNFGFTSNNSMNMYWHILWIIIYVVYRSNIQYMYSIIPTLMIILFSHDINTILKENALFQCYSIHIMTNTVCSRNLFTNRSDRSSISNKFNIYNSIIRIQSFEYYISYGFSAM